MNIFDGIFDVFSGGKEAESNAAMQGSVDALRDLSLPDITKMQVQLEQLVQQGSITPEEAQAVLQQQSEMSGISTDPRFKQAQMDALMGLQEISDEGGLTAADRAKLNQINTEENTAARGQREAILQNMAARGLGGSGMELLSQMQNQQESATRKSQRDMDVAALAQERALQALMQAGQMGGQMQAQEFGQQAQVAGAQDAINRFNAQNRQDVNMANVNARNQAQQANLGERQRIADANTGMRNEQQQYNKQLAQQNFENAYKKAGGVSQTLANQAGVLGQQGQDRRKLIGDTTTAIAAASDERVKTDVEQFDPSSFLDSVTGYKYKYKQPEKYGQGDQVGIMAQDLEKGAPQAVSENAEGTKVIDYNKMGGPIVAAMADLHKRLKELEGK